MSNFLFTFVFASIMDLRCNLLFIFSFFLSLW